MVSFGLQRHWSSKNKLSRYSSIGCDASYLMAAPDSSFRVHVINVKCARSMAVFHVVFSSNLGVYRGV